MPKTIVSRYVSILLVTTSVWAGMESSGPQANLYVGATNSQVNPGKLYLIEEVDSLHPAGDRHTDFTWGLGLGYRFVLPPSTQSILHDISAGLDLFYFKTTQNGSVWQYQHPDFNNYRYQLPIKSLRFMVNSEWTAHPLGARLFPFAVAGFGYARNTASYQDYPLADVGGTGVHLDSRVHYQFAYNLGAGLKLLLTQNMDISFRYLYTKLGDAVTASSGNVSVEAPLKVPLSTQAWLFGLSYLF
ncbi:outer membrane protein [Legionella nagasakiensis]|uniref:outer membrane protein n=1 Tax=Legionella nagasakiensis TaxID=535290 RepID=UPI001055C85F|nr:outer membrane beta-barrel protein [Legionella nagasakiensis]